jgi:hypothetical protein
VQLRLQATSFGEPEVAAYSIELRGECSHPSRLVDRDPTLGDFPRVADARRVSSLKPWRAGRATSHNLRAELVVIGKRMRPTSRTSRLRSPAAAFRRVANEPDVPIRAICRLISSNTDFTYTILHRSCAAMFSEPACHPDAMRLHFAAKRRGIRAPRLSPAAVGLCYYRHFPNQIALADLDDREYQWPPKRGMIAYELLETGCSKRARSCRFVSSKRKC